MLEHVNCTGPLLCLLLQFVMLYDTNELGAAQVLSTVMIVPMFKSRVIHANNSLYEKLMASQLLRQHQ